MNQPKDHPLGSTGKPNPRGASPGEGANEPANGRHGTYATDGESVAKNQNRYLSTTIGGYGTFIFPERGKRGFYRFQTDFEPLVDAMKKRAWNSNSPWEMTAWGTSYIFRRRFSGSYEAKRSVGRILAKIGYPEIELQELTLGGFRIVQKAYPIPKPSPISEKPVSGAYWLKTPPLAGKKRRRSARKQMPTGGNVS